jgi:hypothetical protein
LKLFRVLYGDLNYSSDPSIPVNSPLLSICADPSDCFNSVQVACRVFFACSWDDFIHSPGVSHQDVKPANMVPATRVREQPVLPLEVELWDAVLDVSPIDAIDADSFPLICALTSVKGRTVTPGGFIDSHNLPFVAMSLATALQ